jgi:hypothetical protein
MYVQVVIIALADFDPLHDLSFQTGELPTAVNSHDPFLTNSLISFHIVVSYQHSCLKVQRILQLVGTPTSGVAREGRRPERSYRLVA